MKHKYLYIFITLTVFAVSPVAGFGAASICHDSHHENSRADSKGGCCKDALEGTGHCHESHNNAQVFAPSNNRPSVKLGFTKLFINETHFQNIVFSFLIIK